MLKPFTFIMNRINYNQKFILIGLLFLIPIGFMSYSLASEVQKTITVSKDEQNGLKTLRPVEQLILVVQKHRGRANAYLNGDTSVKAELQQLQNEWQPYLEEINKQVLTYGKQSKIAMTWNSIQTGLTTLQEKSEYYSANYSFDMHTSLIEDLLNLTITISDESGLTLDQESHTYYLMDMIVQRLPQMTEIVAKTRGQATGTLLRGKLDPAELQSYMLDYDRIQNANASLQKDWTSALGYNDKVAELEEVFNAANAAVLDYSTLFKTEILSEKLAIKSDEYFTHGTEAIGSMANLYDEVSALMDHLLDHRIEGARNELIRMFALIGIILLLVVLFFIAFYRNVKGTIVELEKTANLLAEGDASVRTNLVTRDELQGVGLAFNRAAEAFSDLLRSNHTVVEQLAAASIDMESAASTTTQATNQIAQAIQELSSMADQQYAISEQNADAMAEMADGVTRIAESAGTVSDNASRAAANAADGREAVLDAAKRMTAIQRSSDETAEALNRLGQLSDQIGSIAAVMTEIANQTNLLSLNANIEAARAGEHGKGFAVVAQEVKKLSEQSRQSADEIGKLVLEAAEGIQTAFAAMSGSAEETARGMAAMNQLTVLFDGISDAIDSVAQQISDVSASSLQISASTEEVASSVQETSEHSRTTLDKTQEVSASTEEQLASMEEVLASSEALSATAAKLQEMLRRYKY
ncbi:methyl-accepting chemotaxis protein [Paenibacillus xylaniclasticus]|uniref:methyl-accepting chemotaxis protein n=1 Tax=Paenibacillus xylaniclasticus TaxID=588083 RepID=UPI000FD81880|nr:MULTISPECIES: methyl-accepting chemotaxis protein [Paenibacillus]GFN34032.1 methyl-accepting chemotaxis protein [Paenibacillus curdlanolyticus]